VYSITPFQLTLGYNVEMCPFGNRVNTCADANCDDEQVARECCDECYSKQDVTPTPVVDNLYGEFPGILYLDTSW